ncbi:MAG TPA: hypothetical protein VGF32_06870, partial [Streptosporangiaceae bacterium]
MPHVWSTPTMVKPFTVRRATGLAVAAAVALVLSACGSSASSPGASSSAGGAAAGGVYNVGLTTPTGTIDPLTVADYYAMYVVGLASANLIIESPSGKLEPQLATSWTQSPDKLS